MNSDDVLVRLDLIGMTSSSTGKQKLLEEKIDDPLMLRVLKAASDSFTTYGVTAPDLKGVGEITFEDGPSYIWDTLDLLASRQSTGHAAAARIEEIARTHTEASFEVVRRILNKDLRCGITVKTINKVRPGTVRVFEVMLAYPFEEKRVKAWPVAVEPKLDGVRVTCIVKDGEAEFYSRTGKPFPAVAHLKSQVVGMVKAAYAVNPDTYIEGASAVLDGEMITDGHFNQTSGDVRRKSETASGARYIIFDAVPYAEFTAGKILNAYPVRRNVVENLVKYAPDRAVVKVVPRYFANSVEEIQRLYQVFRDRGLEGAIVKPLTGLYEKKRSHAWMKLKGEITHDLIITDVFEGTGKYEGALGGIIVDFDGVAVRVGSGITDDQRRDFWSNPSSIIGRMVEVEGHEVTPDGSIRHPRLVRFRDDKHEKVAA